MKQLVENLSQYNYINFGSTYRRYRSYQLVCSVDVLHILSSSYRLETKRMDTRYYELRKSEKQQPSIPSRQHCNHSLQFKPIYDFNFKIKSFSHAFEEGILFQLISLNISSFLLILIFKLFYLHIKCIHAQISLSALLRFVYP